MKLVVLVLLAALAMARAASFVVTPARIGASMIPPSAHDHWVWLSANHANQSSMLAYAKEYKAWGIPVGGVNLDSSWETGFNTFEFDARLYPDPKAMVDEFHSMGVKVILWITPMINNDTDEYAEAVAKNYVLRNAVNGTGVTSWWHGHYSAMLDYFNPDAVEWWHSRMDKVLDLGIDGWKTDGVSYEMWRMIVPRLSNGSVADRRAWASAYYSDFFDYTRAKLGDDRLIMSRPVDGFEPLWLRFSPRRVALMPWVGDADPTFEGLRQTMLRYLQSSAWWGNYIGFGSDIGGYRRDGTINHGLGRTQALFTRWFQLGAFSTLMENGGDLEHRPWKFNTPGTNDTVDLYRKYVHTHLELATYIDSEQNAAFHGNYSILTPLAPHNTSAQQIQDAFAPETYAFLLGNDVFVSPVMSNTTSSVNVTFPGDSSETWVSYFDKTQVYKGGSTVDWPCPLDAFPVFSRGGAILPLNVTWDGSEHGDRWAAGALSLVVLHPRERGARTRVTFFHNDEGVEAVYTMHRVGGGAAVMNMSVSAVTRADTDLRIVVQPVPGAPAAVSQLGLGGDVVELQEVATTAKQAQALHGTFVYDKSRARLTVRPARADLGVKLVMGFAE